MSSPASNRTRAGSAARSMLLLMVMVALAPSSVRAGPCTAEIDHLQSDINARIDTTDSIGRMTHRSVASMWHHPPTPGSIVQVEMTLGGEPSYEQALAALIQAREADQVDDATSCKRALGAAFSALGR